MTAVSARVPQSSRERGNVRDVRADLDVQRRRARRDHHMRRHSCRRLSDHHRQEPLADDLYPTKLPLPPSQRALANTMSPRDLDDGATGSYLLE